ncbi:5-methylthioadenosine/S-adenosylhomocysteine deaminase [Actinomadura hallensis]|uniref:5-methylthioadenosine/S-adenosylhomocysteine deaminase n=1 Tax=Actinomadura hallensis TaxID=337895 RepID=A0A543INA6_9ACTN|nr:amidohydrolase family protein [Actinomadura hallensis]TQM72073.1 5-methylthioadenosine/S-adenosylhomocysteine deaminase [Actinomadura hallensis]
MSGLHGSSLLVTGGTVVTMAPGREVVADATVAVADGRIAAIGPHDALRAAHPGAAELDARGCVVVPGLINAHQHCTVDPLIRSVIPDDVDAQEAIFGWAVPLHARVTGDDDELAATLTAAESLMRGVTTVLEAGTVAHPERVAAGLSAAGIRGRVGGWGWDAPGVPHSLPAAEALARQEEIVRSLPADGPVTGWITLVGHDLVSDELFTGAAELAERLGTTMTWHMSPGPGDAESYLRRTGARPLVHLRKLGVLGPRLLLGHAVWLDDDEVEAVLATRTAVASCPAAYLRLGQGYTRAGRHGELVRRGGRVALGCDAHNAGDAPDVLRAAGLLAGLENDRGTWPLRADEAFALATCAGAEAVGLGGEIGSIEVGKAADLVVLDTRDPAWTPVGDLAAHLVWGAPGHTVRDVLVGGKAVVRNRRLTTVDPAHLRREAESRSAALLRAAGLDVPRRWPVVPATAAEPSSRPPLVSPSDRKDPLR